MPKRNNPNQDPKVIAFLKAVEAPFHGSYEKATPEEEEAELKLANEAVTELMKDGFDINTQLCLKSSRKFTVADKELSGTVLHLAAHFKRKYFIQALIAKGVDINATNNEGQTALHVAMLFSYRTWGLHCSRPLIEHGINLNVKDNNGDTALDLCASSKQNKDLIQLLIDAGAKYSDTKNLICLEIANQSLHNSNYSSLLKSVDAGSINQVDAYNRTALHYLAFYGKDISPLIQKKADVNALDIYGRTPLHYALTAGEFRTTKKLYELSKWNAEKTLKFTDKLGNNVLHFLLLTLLFCDKKNKTLPLYLQLLTQYLSIFEDQRVVLLLFKENNQGQTPIKYINDCLNDFPKDLCFPGKNPKVTENFFKGYSESSKDSLSVLVNSIFLNLHTIIDDKNLSEDLKREILKQLCNFCPTVLKVLLKPKDKEYDLLMRSNEITSVYLAKEIYNLGIPFKKINPIIRNALIYQTSLIKGMSITNKQIESEIFYGPKIVCEFFNGILPGNSNLPYDLAGLIASFLDQFTLNSILPQVRKSCRDISHSIIYGENKITLKNHPEGKKTYEKDEANDLLWGIIRNAFIPSKELELEEYANAIFNVIATYLECKGIDRYFIYEKLKAFHESNTTDQNTTFYKNNILPNLLNFEANAELKKIHDAYFDSKKIHILPQNFEIQASVCLTDSSSGEMDENGLLPFLTYEPNLDNSEDFLKFLDEFTMECSGEMSVDNLTVSVAPMNIDTTDQTVNIEETQEIQPEWNNFGSPSRQNWFNSPIHSSEQIPNLASANETPDFSQKQSGLERN